MGTIALTAAPLRLLRQIAANDYGHGVTFRHAPRGRWFNPHTGDYFNGRTFHPLERHGLITIGNGSTDPVKVTPAGWAHLAETDPNTSHGCTRENANVPLVAAALAILRDASFTLYQFTEQPMWAGSGAYVEPRTDNGTVILHYQLRGWNHEYQTAGMAHAQYVDLRDEEREERRAALTAYADTFRTHGWHIREYHENRDGVSVLERLIATPTHGPNETQRPPYSDRLDRSTRA